MSGLTTLKKLIFDHFNASEVEGLSFDLGIRHDDLSGDRVSRKIENLLLEAEKQGKLEVLHSKLNEKRPRIIWPTLEDIKSYDWAVMASGWKAGWDGRIPYKGLDPFQEKDAKLFFGREKLVEELLERVEHKDFVAITGPSGSGKSSVARAGLLHALRIGQINGSEHWLLGAMSPKGDPFGELTRMVGRITKLPEAERYICENVRERPSVLKEQLETFLDEDESHKCVLLIDQFEELFTQTKDEVLQQKFVDVLTSSVVETSRIKIVIVMRSDFVSNLIHFEKLRDLANEQMQLVGAMNNAELARSIARPALEVGIEIDPALVDKIVFDMKRAPDALPLMSFSLLDVFRSKLGKTGDVIELALEEYLDRGGVEMALERHAKRVFDQFTAEEEEQAKHVFTKLVKIGDGQADTRRIARFSELVPTGGSKESVENLILKLADKDVRLVALADEGERTVILTHERLIEVWPWLKRLIDQNRDQVQLINEIGNAAIQWDYNQRKVGFLLSRAWFDFIEEKFEGKYESLEPLSNAYIKSGIGHYKKLSRRNKFLTRSLILFAIFASVASILAIRSSRRQYAQTLAAKSQIKAEELSYREAILLAIEATRIDDSLAPEVWNKALTSNYGVVDWLTLEGTGNTISNVKVSSDYSKRAFISQDDIYVTEGFGDLLSNITSFENPEIKLWNPNGRQILIESEKRLFLVSIENKEVLFQIENDEDYEVLFSLDGLKILLYDESQMTMFDIKTGIQDFQVHHEAESIESVSINYDGSKIAYISSTQIKDVVHVWDVQNSVEQIVNQLNKNASSLSWAPDENRLVIAFKEGYVQIWDTTNILRNENTIELYNFDAPSFIRIYWDANNLKIIKFDQKTVEVWNGHDGSKTTSFTFKGDFLGFNLEDDRFATFDTESIYVWDLRTGNQVELGGIDWNEVTFRYPSYFSLKGNNIELLTVHNINGYTQHFWKTYDHKDFREINHGRKYGIVDWQPNGSIIASASGNNGTIFGETTITLWDSDSGAFIVNLEGGQSTIETLAWHPKGQILASGENAGTIRLWDSLNNFENTIVLETDSINPFLAWHPTGEFLASVGVGGDEILIWSIDQKQVIDKFNLADTGARDRVFDLKWSPDGKYLAIARDDYIIGWDFYKKMQAFQFHHSPSIRPNAFRFYADVLDLSWNPESTKIASSLSDNTVRIWDIGSQKEIELLRGHSGRVLTSAWHPEGELLATAGSDKSIKIWDISTGQVFLTMYGHIEDIYSLDWSPNGKKIASASGDNTIQIRSLGNHCDLVYANFTAKQWRENMSSWRPYRPTCPDKWTPDLQDREHYFFLSRVDWLIALFASAMLIFVLFLVSWILRSIIRFFIKRLSSNRI